MADGRKMVCDRCREFVPISEIRYQLKENSRIALCPNCREKADTVNPKPRIKSEDKKPYFCERCKYKFRFDPKKGRALKCPYCGKEDKVTEDKISNAEDLIKQSMGYDH